MVNSFQPILPLPSLVPVYVSFLKLSLPIYLITYLIYRIIVHLVHNHKKITILFRIILILVFLVFFSIDIYLIYAINQEERIFVPAVPSSIRKIADEYIINKVGREYFNKNFVLDKKESIKLSESNFYRVMYEFFPLKQYSIPNINYHIEIRVASNIAREWGEPFVPLCLNDSSLCQFNLSKEELLTFKNKYSITGPLYFRPPHFAAYVCSDRVTKNVMYVDYRTKEVKIEKPGAFPGMDPCSPINL